MGHKNCFYAKNVFLCFSYGTNVSKNHRFCPVAAVFITMMGQRIYTFMTNFLEDSSSVSISSEMDYFYEGICFRNNIFHGNRKRHFLVIIAKVVMRKKKNYFKNLNLTETITAKIGLTGSPQTEIKCHNLKNINF